MGAVKSLFLKIISFAHPIFFLIPLTPLTANTALAQSNTLSATDFVADNEIFEQAVTNEEDLAEIKNLLFIEKNDEDQIQLELQLSDNIVTIGESFFATITVSYNQEIKVKLPGPFLDWQPFYKNSHKINRRIVKDGIVTYSIVYELSTFDLEPKFFKDISVEYWKKGEAPENPPNIITIQGPSIAIKRIIPEEEELSSTIGDMRSAFIINRHLTQKEYLLLAAIIISVLAIFTLTFLWLLKRKRKKNTLLLLKKELSIWEKKIILEKSPSREDLRSFYQKISSIAKKILSIVSNNTTIPSMTAKEIAETSEINNVYQNTKKSFLDFLKKSEEIKYSISTIDIGQALKEIKDFSLFLQTVIYQHRKNLRKKKNHDFV